MSDLFAHIGGLDVCRLQLVYPFLRSFAIIGICTTRFTPFPLSIRPKLYANHTLTISTIIG